MEDPEVTERILPHLQASPTPGDPPTGTPAWSDSTLRMTLGREGGWKRTPPYREPGERRKQNNGHIRTGYRQFVWRNLPGQLLTVNNAAQWSLRTEAPVPNPVPGTDRID